MKGNLFAIIFSGILILLSGCTAVQPFPSSARAGDTVTYAVGSAEGMTKANTQVFYIPDSTGIPIDLTGNVRAIVKLTPDKTSWAYQKSAANFIIDYTGHEAWLTTVVLDLPDDLPVGTGALEINTEGSLPSNLVHVNDVSIPLAITGLGGSPSDFSYYSSCVTCTAQGSLSDLEPLPTITVKPVYSGVSPGGYAVFGAAELTIELSGLTGPRPLNIVQMDADSFTKSQTKMIWGRDGEIIKLLYTSPKAKMRYYEVSSDIVFFSSDTYLAVTPRLLSARFFDADGNEVSLIPEMQFVFSQ